MSSCLRGRSKAAARQAVIVLVFLPTFYMISHMIGHAHQEIMEAAARNTQQQELALKEEQAALNERESALEYQRQQVIFLMLDTMRIFMLALAISHSR
jgi:hypothetical protein